jgi:metal-responsive CopG/Arc/MetJ family transcriptional regulator
MMPPEHELPADLEGAQLHFPASADDEPISGRIPIAWFAQIDELRSDLGTPFPGAWRSRSDFVRFAIYYGLTYAQQLRRRYKGEEVDAFIEAQMFLDGKMAKLQSRANLVRRTGEEVKTLAEAITILLLQGEVAEARVMVDDFMKGAEEIADPFWRGYMIRSLHETAAWEMMKKVEEGGGEDG